MERGEKTHCGWWKAPLKQYNSICTGAVLCCARLIWGYNALT